MSVMEIVTDRESITGTSSRILDPPLPSVPYGRRRSDKIPWAGVTILFIATLLLLFGKSAIPALSGTVIPFELQSTDVGGQMRIRWNRNSDEVVQADSASLEVVDGTSQNRFPLSRATLLSGALDYSRQSGDAIATLILYKNGQESTRRIVRSIGAPVAH